ncbi:UPF0439 protein C9orf30 like protein [Trachymyrmex zeteki]|nr:UPF0439 protein C9orf30 like protein [Trachymyrmex zeteki]
MSKQKSSSKHYTTLEKKILIEILKKYSNVIENKKTDSTTLKEKDKTWNIITEEYNSSSNVTEERSIQQLKKLWANMKATQRNILTKERQARLGTGGGPEEKVPEIDPDIALVSPNLLEMAPTQFSSDLSEAEMRSKYII